MPDLPEFHSLLSCHRFPDLPQVVIRCVLVLPFHSIRYTGSESHRFLSQDVLQKHLKASFAEHDDSSILSLQVTTHHVTTAFSLSIPTFEKTRAGESYSGELLLRKSSEISPAVYRAPKASCRRLGTSKAFIRIGRGF